MRIKYRGYTIVKVSQSLVIEDHHGDVIDAGYSSLDEAKHTIDGWVEAR